MCGRLSTLFLALSWLPASRSQGICASLHCGMESAKCLLEPKCREIMECILGCKGDMGCQYLCGTEEYSLANIEMTNCLQEHDCLPHVKDTKTPDDFTDRLDHLQTVPFKKSDMYGQWWINYGLNVALDCVPCQSFHFSSDPANSSLYTVHQKFRSFKNRLWNYVNYTALFDPLDASKGVFDDQYNQGGFGGKDVWYILGMDGDEMAIAYFADSNWITHGVFVMSRAANRVVSNPGKWRSVLQQNQIHWSNICQVDVTSSDCGNLQTDEVHV